MICKYWEGTTHVDLGGNVVFIHEESVKCIQDLIESISNDTDRYIKMKDVAEKKGMEIFSYERIAERAIGNN